MANPNRAITEGEAAETLGLSVATLRACPSRPPTTGGAPERFGTDVDAISASYSYFNALIGSTRDARCAGMKPAHSATSASATAESASTAGSAPVI